MDASAVPPRLVRSPAASTRLAHWAVLAATSSLMLVAGWLAARRLSGALQRPLHGPAWVAVILLLALSGRCAQSVRRPATRCAWRLARCGLALGGLVGACPVGRGDFTAGHTGAGAGRNLVRRARPSAG